MPNDRVIQVGRALGGSTLNVDQAAQDFTGFPEGEGSLAFLHNQFQCCYPHSGNLFLLSSWNLSWFGLCPLCLIHFPLCGVWLHLFDANGHWELLLNPTEANPAPGWTSPAPSASPHRPSAPTPATTVGLS